MTKEKSISLYRGMERYLHCITQISITSVVVFSTSKTLTWILNTFLTNQNAVAKSFTENEFQNIDLLE